LVLLPAILLALTVWAVLPPPARGQEVTKRHGFAIKITQPTNQDFVIGRTKLVAEVKIDKPAAVEKVEFYVGDKLVFIDEEPPYECFYDFGKESKELVIKAIATHREGITVSDFIVTRKIALSFAVRVNRVLVDATVFDKEGNFVNGLGKGDFVVQEEGAPREIIDFAPENRPILLGILLDVSGSMQEKIDEAQKAAIGFVDRLNDADHAMLVEFSEKVYMLSDLTNDWAGLKRLIASTKAIGGTALYDALHSTLRRLGKRQGRKAIVILSDGEDTNSQTQFKQVLEEAKGADATIYTIALGSGFADPMGHSKLKELAEQTGGRPFNVSKASQLEGVYTKIADELRRQYSLTYASENEKFDGRWVPIKIEAKQKGLEVRSRKGYYAAPPAES